ncbi:RAMP superfamily CRISPR-associated protein [Iningainema tapete]|uniref:Type III-B CRISPR module RAMP protein Cmr4 n=1 Tax=Iningainema tapete BLCC-T55 TaxID=2748662 RepID=A0A8J6XFB3_9CYAN|nr:RAMP superfamily CRISPR-associated protein [Iningainema tapete]MBD2775565.1 type III-B CRISPR module RAMP protein Cmr4 [Iningainema tapete BLCC-T55]
MYKRAYGIIETLAPLHVGASAGEETGNLNLIFRDQFTQTGIIPGSSIRGRFRADMRANEAGMEANWYGHHVVEGREDGGTTEALVKFEYASLVWLPVFCPGQPVVWISCPRLLKRYKLIAGISESIPAAYTAPKTLQGRQVGVNRKVLFFNLGFMEIEQEADLSQWIPSGTDLPASNLVVVGDNDIAMLHDMGLYRQSRVKLLDEVKKVDTDRGGFFNVEALPEGSILVFPVALKEKGWKPFGDSESSELYFGGLESVGFGRCRVTLGGEYK